MIRSGAHKLRLIGGHGCPFNRSSDEEVTSRCAGSDLFLGEKDLTHEGTPHNGCHPAAESK